MPRHNRKKLSKKTGKVKGGKCDKLKYQSEQKCPRKLKELDQTAESDSSRKFLDSSTKESSRANKFRRLMGETEYQFINRMNEEVNVLITASKNTADTQPEIKEHPSKKKEKCKQRLKNRSEKKKLKLKNKLSQKVEEEMWKDVVQFGEVVLKPPELKIKPRKGTSQDTNSKRNFCFMDKFAANGKEFAVK